jgi:hypothetical protein
MDEFIQDWLNDLLVSVEKYTDNKTWNAIMNACIHRCADYWISQAQEIRESNDDSDVDLLLESFRNILSGGSALSEKMISCETLKMISPPAA